MSDWIAGPPIKEGLYWVYIPSWRSVIYAEVVKAGGKNYLWIEGNSDVDSDPSLASHHIPIPKPEPPVQQ